jgi:hypothetical protein
MVNKTKQSHKRTLGFTWFPQCEVHAEAIMNEFTIKNEIQNSEEKITQNPNPQYTKISLPHKKILFPKRKKRRRINFSFARNKWRLVSLYFAHTGSHSLLVFSCCDASNKKQRRFLLCDPHNPKKKS